MPPKRGKKRPRSGAQRLSLIPLASSLARPLAGTIEERDQDRKKMQRPRPQKIIVLGAGVSGLACSRELRQRGYEVLVIEARSRVGGRLKGEVLELGAEYPCTLPESLPVKPLSTLKQQKRHKNKKNKTSELDSDANSNVATTRQHPVDVGGALIHGIENNPIYDITSQMGVPMHGVSSYCLLMDENGWPFDPKIDEKSSNFFNECLDVTFARAEKDRESKESFGALFEKVCREKSGNSSNGDHNGINGKSLETKKGGKLENKNKDWETPLLKWHRANLELPTGASFYDLGHTWNEDEPYGFDGDHAAVEPSWKLVMEQLADGLDILDNSPVTEIRVVLPNGTTPLEIPKITKSEDTPALATTNVTTSDKSSSSIEESKEVENKTDSTELMIEDEVNEEPTQESEESKKTIPSPPALNRKKIMKRTKKPKKAFAAAVDAAENRRFSRRTRNIDINVRRSSRSTKGVIERMDIDRSYHESTRRKRRKTSNITSEADGRKSKKSLDNDGVKKTQENGDQEIIEYLPSSVVQVTLQDGKVLEADALVCTLPLGILKLSQKDSNYVRFVPSLDSSKKYAIESLGCGLLNKCAMSFPNVFWQDSDFLGQAESDYSYLVLNAMKYTQKPILIFMYGGDFARDVEDWTDRDIISDCLEVLKKICGVRDIPAPIDYCVTRWGKEEYSRMAFTYVPPGVDGGKALNTISQPVCDPVLPKKPLIMFAGEHTTPYHPSTMHGAFLSGIREAHRFDLFMEPLLNDHTEFDENIHVYKHSFPTKRVYKRTRAKRDKSKGNKPSIEVKNGTIPSTTNKMKSSSNCKSHSRRRGFGGMTLRKRPEMNVTLDVVNEKVPAGVSSITSSRSPRKNGVRNISPEKIGSRRSQRSVGSVRNSILSAISLGKGSKLSDDEDVVEEGEKADRIKSESKARTDQQEERTLKRALESYGPESHALVRSHILPVYGSTRRRNLKHISDRWKGLRRDNMSNNDVNKDGPSTLDLVKSWEAKHVASDNWNTHLARIAADAAKEATSSESTDGPWKTQRRSFRSSKPRTFLDS